MGLTQKKRKIQKQELINEFYNIKKEVNLYPVWNKLYRSSIIKQNNIYFNKEWSHGEDAIFNLNYYKCMRSMIIIPDKLYNYKKTSSSLSSGYLNNYIDGFLSREYHAIAIYKELGLHYDNLENYKKEVPRKVNKMFNNLFHSNSKLTYKETITEIIKVLDSSYLKEYVNVFFRFGLFEKILGFLLLLKKPIVIYLFYYFRYKLRKSLW